MSSMWRKSVGVIESIRRRIIHTATSPLRRLQEDCLAFFAHREYPGTNRLCHSRFARGVVEGLNDKAKLTTRKAYGFKTFRMLEVALYHILGELPEPDFTHIFFLRGI